MAIEVREVTTEADQNLFATYPFRLYGKNKFWVPPILKMEKENFDPNKNKALDFCNVRQYLFFKNGEVKGRTAVILNEKEAQKTGKREVRFGWTDFDDDYDISTTLFNTIEEVASSLEAEAIKGPYGFSNLDKAGWLIDGFDEIGSANTIYNYPYYIAHIENQNYEKLVDWIEFELTPPAEVPEKIIRISKLLERKYGIRAVDLKSKSQIRDYKEQFFDVLNDAYSHLEGFVPIGEDLADHYFENYFPVLDPRFITLIVDENDKLLGFGIVFPSLSRALQKAKGKLWPFGWYHLNKAMRSPNKVEMSLIAVRREYHKKGLIAIMFERSIRAVVKNKVKRVESNPQLEHNKDVLNLWKDYDMRINRERRTFIKKI